LKREEEEEEEIRDDTVSTRSLERNTAAPNTKKERALLSFVSSIRFSIKPKERSALRRRHRGGKERPKREETDYYSRRAVLAS